jgi:hypothetical protein
VWIHREGIDHKRRSLKKRRGSTCTWRAEEDGRGMKDEGEVRGKGTYINLGIFNSGQFPIKCRFKQYHSRVLSVIRLSFDTSLI